MTIEHTTSLLEECLAIYLDLGFSRVDYESVGGPSGIFLLSPDGEDDVNLIPSSEPTSVKHFVSAVFTCPDKELPKKLKNKGYKISVKDLEFVVKMPDGFRVKMAFVF